MKSDAPLSAFRLSALTSIATAVPPPAPSVTLASPALAVVTDLTRVKAAVIHPDATLVQAEQTMIHQGVRMLFVVIEMPGIVGLVSTTDLDGDRAMRVVQQRQLRHDELRVVDVMTPLADLDAIDHDDLRTATVGNLVATLRRFGHNHLLVVEGGHGGQAPRVCGIVSRTQIERQTGQAIELTEIASSFAEIERALV